MTLYNRESHLLADEKYQLTRDHTRKLLSCMDANNSLLFVFTSGTNTARKKNQRTVLISRKDGTKLVVE
jgi:hypothetical protein